MILVTGAAGQLGSEVVSELDRRKKQNMGTDVADLDITDEGAVRAFFLKHTPSCVIHCAAYTLVDKAEEEPELCMRVNLVGTENIALACNDVGAEMIYISTDYVFGGESGLRDAGTTPYETDSPAAPLQVYGRSKLQGEEAVKRRLKHHYIVRTSWVFGRTGNNFVRTVLCLSQKEAISRVVNDQIGSPTYAPDLAGLLCDMVLSGKHGVFHATNEGFCSWAQFAEEIMKLSGRSCRIIPVSSEEYPAKATRPKNSRLSKASLDAAGFQRLPSWQDALARFLYEIGEAKETACFRRAKNNAEYIEREKL